MPTIIEERFRSNLDRVRKLVTLYERESGFVSGRPTVHESDILRAAIVLLHSSLEDLLRSLAASKLPGASDDVLRQIPFPGGDGRKTTLTLGDLAAYRGRVVDQVISVSVEAYLSRLSLNNTDDVAKLLGQIGLNPSLIAPHANNIQAMMKRRHHIAHRVDRDESPGRGHHQARSVSKSLVEKWIASVERLGRSLLPND
jgi:hypothetical protein